MPSKHKYKPKSYGYSQRCAEILSNGSGGGGGGDFDNLANHCCQKKVKENTVTISLAAWPTFDQFSCIFENIGRHRQITDYSALLTESRKMSSLPHAAISLRIVFLIIQH